MLDQQAAIILDGDRCVPQDIIISYRAPIYLPFYWLFLSHAEVCIYTVISAHKITIIITNNIPTYL